jgi:hypothetical protein
MILLLALLIGLLIGLGATLAVILRALSSQGSKLPLTAEWIDQLSADRYRPMLRLLEDRDIQFLRSQPGYDRHMEARLRAQRSQVFRSYLKCLDADFKRTCAALRVVMMHSQNDRPDLASSLIRSQITFACGRVVVQFRVALYRFGLANVDVRGLVKLFDGMRVELRTMVPSSAGALA